MRVPAIALTTFLGVSSTYAFAPSSHMIHSIPTRSTPSALFQPPPSCNAASSRRSTSSSILNSGGGLLEPDDEDEDEEEEEDDGYLTSGFGTAPASSYASTSSSLAEKYAGLKLDPFDPNPYIKPRPGRYGFREDISAAPATPDADLEQTMTDDERAENLTIMRKIKKEDLEELRMRKDHAGWIEANAEMTRRENSDPWFALNERSREAYQLGDEEELQRLQALVKKVGGAPPGVPVDEKRGYTVYTEIMAIPISKERAESQREQSMIAERVKRGKAMIAERKKNQEREQKEWEETMRNPLTGAEKKGAELRERTMRKMLAEIEEDNKKSEERAREVLGEIGDPKSMNQSLDEALEMSKQDILRIRKMRREGRGLGVVSDEADLSRIASDKEKDDDDDDKEEEESKPKGSAARARAAAEAEAAGGRPRLPGDVDIKLGEIDFADGTSESDISSSSDVSGPVTVAVTSSYNTDQSDPPMRKHCFQYTIKITNNSPTDTVQLISRRFEIQTVGSSMKDVVQGKGVTGRQPVLKPGETFEYTSTAPLSVRPIGTTIIAARMSGEYKYVRLQMGQTTASDEQVEAGGDASATLGTFHFIFPPEQRVKPIRTADEDEDDDEDDDDDDDTSASSKVVDAVATPVSQSSTSSSATTPAPATTLPGDADMIAGDITVNPPNDSSDTLTSPYLRVQVTSTYRPERSDPKMDKHCFAYSVRITNIADAEDDSASSVQLVSRRFEIQTIGSETKDVVQGPGVTGRQPLLKPGESFEYTSTAPLSVKPMQDKTGVVARMEGEYSFVVSGEDNQDVMKAKMGMFHFVLPEE